jgi:hypothetical protein
VRVKRILVLTAVIFAATGGVATASKLITSNNIKNGTIQTVDMSASAKAALKGNIGPQGVHGPTGAPGPRGAQGPAGSAASNAVTTVTATKSIAPGVVDGMSAYCPAGKVAVGSGFFNSVTDIGFVKSYGTSVGAAFINRTSNAVDVEVQALCAPGSTSAAATATTASATAATASKGDSFQRDLAELQQTERL